MFLVGKMQYSPNENQLNSLNTDNRTSLPSKNNISSPNSFSITRGTSRENKGKLRENYGTGAVGILATFICFGIIRLQAINRQTLEISRLLSVEYVSRHRAKGHTSGQNGSAWDRVP